MTDDQIHKEVLKVMGWKWETRRSYRETPAWFKGSAMRDELPPLTLDLMWQAVKTLSLNEWTPYLDALDEICVPVHICPTTHWMALVEADALQRAKGVSL